MTSTSETTPPTLDTIDLTQPFWYHTWPGHPGPWVLSNLPDQFLGGVQFGGKTVLEVGPASGFVTRAMEQLGATVDPLDIGGGYHGDFLTTTEPNTDAFLSRLNDSFRVAAQEYGIRATLRNGSIYDHQPQSQIGVIANVLLHLRDPIKALYRLCEASSERVIIVETCYTMPLFWWVKLFSLISTLPWRISGKPIPEPIYSLTRPGETIQCDYWFLSKAWIERHLTLFGFETESVTFHRQVYCGRSCLNYTIVAKRISAGAKMKS